MRFRKMFADTRTKAGAISRREVYARALKLPLRTSTVMYESFSGNGALCNPEAIFNYLTSQPQYSNFKHVWVLKKSSPGYDSMVRRLKARGNVQIVEYRSPSYWTALATSQYVLNNATFPWEFVKREGQIYVNLWHGTPLKKMGYDIEGGGPDTRNIVRNFVAADYLISANPRMSDMYLRSYRMDGIYRGKVLETGYPRTDRQQVNAAERTEAIAMLAEQGIDASGRKLVVFAPTWKGNSFYSPSQDGEGLLHFAEALEARLGSADFKVVLKVHQALAEHASSLREARGRLVPNSMPTNLILGLADVLVTDYSSIFFDYLQTRRPLSFYIPDLLEYEGSRGIYDAPDQLPGPLSTDLEGLAKSIEQQLAGGPEAVEWRAKREEAALRFTPHEDGSSARRVVEAVFHHKIREDDVVDAHPGRKRSILLYLGGMASNGITSSALNLLRSLDHDRIDVSVLYSYSRQKDKLKNEALIDPRVRLFARQGTVTATLRQRAQYTAENKMGLPASGKGRHRMDAVWAREWRRCFGDAQFDHVIDFSGYSPFWSRILLGSGRAAGSKSVWLHNDLVADSRRTVDGKQAHKMNLESMFTLYRSYDHLVSVSESLMELNRENLKGYAPAEKFTFAVNTIDHERILRMSAPVEATVVNGTTSVSLNDGVIPTVRSLVAAYGAEPLAEALGQVRTLQQFNLDGSESGPVFVAVGRLSPEKNHERLIRAMAIVVEKHPGARLLILGGGPLRKDLDAVVSRLRLEGSVTLAGLQNNPYLLMKNSDYFVMSSDYEGQPMVILEARVLGLPVITTAFGSVASAVPAGTGVVVERTVEALAAGMCRAIDEHMSAATFDAVAYNQEAVGQFLAAIGLKNRKHR